MPGARQRSERDLVDATAVLVNHNSGDRLGPLADAVLAEVPELIVVDNASKDGSLQSIDGRAGVHILRNEDNVGFAAAVNRGALEGERPWLLLVNPDIHLRPDDIRTLLQRVPDDVAAVAPLQVDERGHPRAETGGYDSTLPRYLVWAVVPTRFHGRFGPWLAPPWPEHDQEMDWASGALLGVRRSVFERMGGFDERYFLYHEDVDFGRRARSAGYRILCRPAVRLHHEVAHGEPSRRVNSTLRSIESLSLDPNFTGLRRRGLGLVLGLGYGLRAILGGPTTKACARAALPFCRDLIRGRLPGRAADRRPGASPV
jgi:N-acetylglucosaminyl-diphospho-decaprenol L-rhamnosyltransferase